MEIFYMINSKTKLIGILGYPLGHSLSPLMHNQVLAKMGLNYVYLPLEVRPDDIAKAVEAVRVFDMLGVNVTIPHKERVTKYLDDISPEAKACGAVNLIKHTKGRLVGHNTDGDGFIAGLREDNIDYKGDILLLGAGGAAKAVGYALARAGAKSLTFLNNDEIQAAKLADYISEQTKVNCRSLLLNQANFNDIAIDIDMLINCTPVGMYPNIDAGPMADLARLKSHVIVCDLIYNPLKTKFLTLAEANSLRIVNGLPMFIHQGALTFEILTELSPPINYMKEVVLNHLVL